MASILIPEIIKSLVLVSPTEIKVPAGSTPIFGGKQKILDTDINLTISGLVAYRLYYAYLILNGSTVQLILSLNDPSIGPGYTLYKCVGAIQTTAAGALQTLTTLDFGSSTIGKIYPSLTPLFGFIPMTGLSIGKDGSGATYQGNVFKPLYDLAWTIPGLTTTAGYPYRISTTKGSTSQSDWDALKTITFDLSTNEVFIRAKGGSTTEGSYQVDDHKSHNHGGSTTGGGNHGHDFRRGTVASFGSEGIAIAPGSTIDSLSNVATDKIVNNSNANHSHTIGSSGGTENRPKNVAHHHYIRYLEKLV